MNAILKAIALTGSQQALADACGVSQAAVSKWANGQRVSAEKCLAIANATGWAVAPSDLRPDLFAAMAPARPEAA